MSGTPSVIFHANVVKLVSLKSGRGANMGTRLRTILLVLCCFFVSVKCKEIHTSGKLDFGDSSAPSSLVKTEKRFPMTISRSIETVSSPSDVTSKVSCGPTGCNATNDNNTVETEVVVHVQTKVNFDQTQNKKVVENEPEDVPVVLGYRGTRPDDTADEERFRNEKPDIADRRYGFNGNGYGNFRPLYTDSPVSIGPAYNQRNRPSTSFSYFGSTTYRPSTNRYYGSSVTPTASTYGYYNPSSRYPDNYASTRPLGVNNIHSSVQIPNPNRRNYDYNYKENGLELPIPHFDHTFNKHYFSEEAPPHTILLGKINTYNPVEFKGIPRNKWKPSFWNGRNHKYAFSDGENNFMNSYHRGPPIPEPIHHRNHGTECSCRDHRSDTSDGSNSYAASSVSHHIAVPNKDPGASIDDKLAPLN